MPDLEIVVCMKVVPKSEEIRVDTETMLLERGVRSEINPPDMNALELALALKDDQPARISIISMGPPFFEPILRVGLAMGADRFYLMSDREFGGADTLATTYTLAKGIEKIGNIDLILCGEESADGATGQVPPGLAEWLDMSQVTLATELSVDPEKRIAHVRREIKGGYEIQDVNLPSVISVKTASNEPRFMDFHRKKWAFEEAEVAIWSHDDVDVEKENIGLTGSPTGVSGLREAEVRERRKEFLRGSPEEIAKELAERLQGILEPK
ncbi:MAG: electron transfer flavoprotein subunit beta/FixA family protein [Anaerolineales bacterium]|nr:electron transfer flavoprotein subunit beta/FixA family protein [Anaerolineales bacterium]